MDTPTATYPGPRWTTCGVIFLNAILPSLLVVLWLWPLAQRTAWQNYWFDDRYLYDQVATMQERLGLLGDDPSQLDAVRDRMPLYPLMVRGFRRIEVLTGVPVPAWSILANVLAHAFSALLLYQLVHTLGRQNALALFAALLWPWLPGVLPYTLAQLPEAASTFLCLVAAYLLLSESTNPSARAGLAGVALAAATLFKPVFCTYSIPLLLLIWLHAGTLKRPGFYGVLAFITAFLVTLAPWLARNYHVWGKATLTPNGMAHIANARDAMAADLGLPAVDPRVPQTPEGWRSLGIDPANLHMRSVYRSRLAWQDLNEQVPGCIRVACYSLLKLHASTGVGALVTMSSGNLARESNDHQPEPRLNEVWSPAWSTLHGVALVILGLTYLLGLAGLVALWKQPGRLLFWWSVMTLAYFVALSVPFGNTRYRYPAMPAYAVLAAAGFTSILHRRARRPA